MFDRLTEEGRAVVASAEAEAVSSGHRHIGTEHLLLGLLDEAEGAAAAVLAGAGLDRDAVRAGMARILGDGEVIPDDAVALRSIGIDLDAVRASVEERFGAGALDRARPPARRRSRQGCRPASGRPRLTPRAERVLELALRQSLQLRDPLVGPEHILLGLLAEGGGVAAQILSSHGALDELRRRTLQALGKVA